MMASFQRCAIGASLILLGACGGVSQVPLVSSGGTAPTVPLGRQNVEHAPALMTHGSFVLPQLNRGKSWMSSQWRKEQRNPQHKKRLLLYVGVHGYFGSVDILDYKTGAMVGQVSGDFVDPGGLCSDREGNVYVADYAGEGSEIQAGTTEVIKTWPTAGRTDGCAVSDGGDVAFSNWETGPDGGGNVEVFPGGGPTGIIHYGPGHNDMPAAYDDKGNLFISSGSLWELPAGDNSWRRLNSDRPMPWGAVEWDGRYLAVTCNESFEKKGTCIKQVSVSASTAKVVNNVRLLVRRGLCGRYLWLDMWAEDAREPDGQTTSPATQIAAIDGQCDPAPILVWSYPAGGTPKRTIDVERYAEGATIVKI